MYFCGIYTEPTFAYENYLPVDGLLMRPLLLLPELVKQRLPRHLLQLLLVAPHVRPVGRRRGGREGKRRRLDRHRTAAAPTVAGGPLPTVAGGPLPHIEGGAVANGVRRGRGSPVGVGALLLAVRREALRWRRVWGRPKRELREKRGERQREPER